MQQQVKRFSENINEQIIHDAPFAWFMRQNACQSAVYSLEDVKELDIRLTNYLHALQLTEQNGLSLADTLELSDWGARFVLFWLGIECGNHDYCLQASEGIIDEDESDELATAFSWFSQLDKVEVMLKTLGDTPDSNPWVKRAAIEACKLNDISLTPDYIATVLGDDDSISQVAILDYLTAQRLDYQALITPLLDADDAPVVLAATTALAYQPTPVCTWQDFLPLIERNDTELKAALKHAMIIADAEGMRKILAVISTDDYSERLKIYAMGISGLVEYLPYLISLTENEKLAQIAGESIANITGLDIEEDDLSLAHGDYVLKGFGESDDEDENDTEDDDWQSDYEEDLPYPDAQGLTTWWGEKQSNFDKNTRYLSGLPITAKNVQKIVSTGNQIQRELAAFHLAYLDKTQKIFQVTAGTKRQYQQLNQLLEK